MQSSQEAINMRPPKFSGAMGPHQCGALLVVTSIKSETPKTIHVHVEQPQLKSSSATEVTDSLSKSLAKMQKTKKTESTMTSASLSTNLTSKSKLQMVWSSVENSTFFLLLALLWRHYITIPALTQVLFRMPKCIWNRIRL